MPRRRQKHIRKEAIGKDRIATVLSWCASQGSVLIVPLARIRQVFFENDLSSPTYLSNERRQGV